MVLSQQCNGFYLKEYVVNLLIVRVLVVLMVIKLFFSLFYLSNKLPTYILVFERLEISNNLLKFITSSAGVFMLISYSLTFIYYLVNYTYILESTCVFLCSTGTYICLKFLKNF